ncbi:hypothetical protein [Streptosporangium pseudovulgare]|uniref:hypothetical protein n=1 Tax=Streptosporangium pseudovulgare TaxID=35765 RepID=UPI00166F83CD|nr:hypothetical protein [Streptosporangium pseudovulgare]
MAVMKAARIVRDELDRLLGGSSGELRGRLDPLLAEEGRHAPGPLADAIVMLIVQYGPVWERFSELMAAGDVDGMNGVNGGEPAGPGMPPYGPAHPGGPLPGSPNPPMPPPGPGMPLPGSPNPPMPLSGPAGPGAPPPAAGGPNPPLPAPAGPPLIAEPVDVNPPVIGQVEPEPPAGPVSPEWPSPAQDGREAPALPLHDGRIGPETPSDGLPDGQAAPGWPAAPDGDPQAGPPAPPSGTPQATPPGPPPGQATPPGPPTGQAGPEWQPPGQVGPEWAPPGQAGPPTRGGSEWPPPGQAVPLGPPHGPGGPSGPVWPPSGPAGAPPPQTGPAGAPPARTGPEWPPPGLLGSARTEEAQATTSVRRDGSEEPHPARPAQGGKGPSVLGRLTGAFRRRRAESVPSGPAWAGFPLIQVTGEVVAGAETRVEVGVVPGDPGVTPGAPPGNPAAGPGAAPASPAAPYTGEPFDLDVQLVAEGFEAPGGWRVRLRVDPATPYPRTAVRLVALPQEQPVTARQIQAVHSVRGQVTGFGVRALAVVGAPGTLPQEGDAQPVAGTRVRTGSDADPPDVTAVVVHGDQPGRLWWTYHSPHFLTPDRAEACELGTRISEFGRNLAEQAGSLDDMGRRIAARIPRGFWELLHAVAARVAPRRPNVLIVSQETHVPWELAALEHPFDPSVPPFLNCQTVTGRWPLGGRRPELPPPARAAGRSMAVVYGGAEPHPLTGEYGAARINPVLGEVLALLSQPTDMVHFTAGGSAAEALGRGMGGAPFVFLEEPDDCQAFLLAGASAVVAPLWPVGDDGLPREFYRRCLAGEPPAEVLRSLRCQAPATATAYRFFGHPSLTLSPGGPPA